MESLKCKFELKTDFVRYKCPHPHYKNDVCIFHIEKAPKEDEEKMNTGESQKYKEITSLFWRDLENYMASTTDEKYEFIGFNFPSFFWGKGKVFDREIDFKYAKFLHGLNISNGATFIKRADFDFATFHNARFYSELTFKEGVSFRGAEFYHDTCFQMVVCEGGVSFAEAKFFSNYCDFIGTEFKGGVNFDSARFFEDSSRRDISSKKNPQVTFSSASFENYSLFHGTHFYIEASFRGSKFFDTARFVYTDFHKRADFSRIEVDGELNFQNSEFQQIADFNKAIIRKELNFEGRDRRCFKGEGDFNKLKVSKDTKITFDKADLSKASFLYTNLEEIKFFDVDWFKKDQKNKFFSSRPQLWDEERLDSANKLYERVADNYRQLVNNYEKKRDFETAEYFHIGEMEIRRKKLRDFKIENKTWRWFRSYFNATGFYWLSSRYGSSYSQALIILIFLAFVVIPIIFLFAGFQTGKEINVENPKVIDFTLFSSPENLATPSQIWEGYWQAISYTFSIITFQRDRFFVPLGDSLLSQMALYLAIFLLTTQGALVILAIRRQFRR